MNKIILQFSTQKNIGSKILHVFDHIWCSHVDAVLPEGGLLGAKWHGGVTIRPNKGFVKKLVVELPTTAEIETRFYDFLKLQLGKPYDWQGILAFVVDRHWDEDDSWFCSELIGAALQYSGFLPYKLFSTANKITPQDLMVMCNMFVEIGEPIHEVA